MSEKLKLAPVFYTLAQITFNPISQMNEYVSNYQEKLRHRGYPDFNEEIQNGISIDNSNNAAPNIIQKKYTRWSFDNIEKNKGIILSDNSLVFHTTNYDTFEIFLYNLLEELKLLHEIVNISFIDKVGLRYLNLIEPSEGKNIDNYLRKELLGLSDIEGDFIHSFSETLINLMGGALVTKSFITNGTAILPPDLSPLKLQINPRFTSLNNKVRAILDIDFFTQKRFELKLDTLEKTLKTSHEVISESFKSSVTEDAINAWR